MDDNQRRVTELDDIIINLRASLQKAEAAREEAVVQTVPHPRTNMITYTLKHDADRYGRQYQYVAVRVRDRWYHSGSTCPPRGYDWTELRRLLIEKAVPLDDGRLYADLTELGQQPLASF